MKNKNNIALLILIVCSLVSLFLVLSERNRVERANNQVEFIMEYSDIESLETNSDYSFDEWLNMFSDMGLESVAIGSQTLSSYMTEYGISSENYIELQNKGSEIFTEYSELEEYGENSLILYVREKERAEFLSNSLSFYENLNFLTIYDDKTNYIIIDQDKKDVLKQETGDVFNDIGQNLGTTKVYYGTEVLNMPIGFAEEKIEIVRQSGLKVMLRPLNYSLDAKGAWELYLSEIDKYGLDSKMFFPYGSELIGYEENGGYIDEVVEFIEKNDLTFGLVETMEQRDHYELDGYEDLLEILDEDKYVRIFNTWPFISNRYKYLNKYEGVEEITNSYYRAITERNIRAVYLRPFSADTIRIVTDPLEYEDMFTTLSARLDEHGYSYGSATTFEEMSVSIVMKIILTIEVAGFLIVLLNYLLLTIKLKYNVAFLALCSLLISGAFFVAPNTATSLAALVSAIVFSTLATTVFIKECLINTKHSNFFKGILFTFICGFIAMIGGLYVGALMSSTSYYLEFQYFRGVKISLALPILAVAFFTLIFYAKEIYAQKGNGFFTELKETTTDFLNANVKIKYVIYLGVIGVVGLIYIARGSNTSNVEPLDIELMMRNFLENALLARPRTKEFLISFPLMVFGTYFAGNKYFYENKSETGIYLKYSYILLFAVVSALGLASITNTFSHIRTPIYISIWRTVYGLGLGVIVGCVYIIGFKIFVVICKKILGLTSKFKGDILDT